jgi:hypothetical protein
MLVEMRPTRTPALRSRCLPPRPAGARWRRAAGGATASGLRHDTVTTAAVDLVRGGLPVGRRGVTGVAAAALLPGRCSERGARVEIRTISGREATDRAGAAERLGLSLSTVRMLSAPARRAETGFPAPLPERAAGRDWFALNDLDAYRDARAEPPGTPPPGDPAELIDLAEFAALRGVTTNTMTSYVWRSLNDWDAGRDGYLPYPDDIEPARHGNVYRWRRGRAAAWAFPQQRRTGGRTAGPAPTVADLEAVLAAAGDQPLKNREIAAALSERLDGRQVSVQTVLRLNRKRRDSAEPDRDDV